MTYKSKDQSPKGRTKFHDALQTDRPHLHHSKQRPDRRRPALTNQKYLPHNEVYYAIQTDTRHDHSHRHQLRKHSQPRNKHWQQDLHTRLPARRPEPTHHRLHRPALLPVPYITTNNRRLADAKGSRRATCPTSTSPHDIVGHAFFTAVER